MARPEGVEPPASVSGGQRTSKSYLQTQRDNVYRTLSRRTDLYSNTPSAFLSVFGALAARRQDFMN